MRVTRIPFSFTGEEYSTGLDLEMKRRKAGEDTKHTDKVISLLFDEYFEYSPWISLSALRYYVFIIEWFWVFLNIILQRFSVLPNTIFSYHWTVSLNITVKLFLDILHFLTFSNSIFYLIFLNNFKYYSWILLQCLQNIVCYRILENLHRIILNSMFRSLWAILNTNHRCHEVSSNTFKFFSILFPIILSSILH